MSDSLKSFAFLGLLIHGLVVCAQTPVSLAPFLPSEEEVKTALFSSPLIDMARSKKDAGTARAMGIEAGSSEFTVRASAQRRQEMLLGSQLPESMVSIEKPIRAWG